MSDQQKIIPRSLEELIISLCDIILVDRNKIDDKSTENYIKSLTEEERKLLRLNSFENAQKVRTVVLTSITIYLSRFQDSDNSKKMSPFGFAEGAVEYSNFCIQFREKYKEIYKDEFPVLLKTILIYIQDITDHFRIFTIFYDIRNNEMVDSVINEVQKIGYKVKEDSIVIASDVAEEQATSVVEKIVHKEVNEAIEGKMSDVSLKISETSVTILGIFAGIVLTIVAGLFYSSSVLESVSSTNVHKLILMATVVGFVCINIIAVMFDYITKIKEQKKSTEENSDTNQKSEHWFLKAIKNHLFIIILNGILIVIMAISSCTYKEPVPNDIKSNNAQEYNAHISFDVNMPENIVTDQEPELNESESFKETESVIIEKETEIYNTETMSTE